MRKKFPFYKQLDQMDCGPTCLKMIAKYYGKSYDLNYLREKASIDKTGVSLGGIADAAESIGLQTLGVSLPYQTLEEEVPLPCIAYWKQRHFVVVYKIQKGIVYVADPAHGLLKYTKNEFLKGWISTKNQTDDSSKEGILLLLETTPEFYNTEEIDTSKKKGFKFLFPYFKPHYKSIYQLLLGLFVTSLLQLVLPFLTQAVVDYGINYQNLNFIYLILVAQLTLFISQTSVQAIRSWLLLHMTSRINIKLLSTFLIKLMKLPLSFFDSKNIGDLMQRIQDHRRVQDFLSSNSLNIVFGAFSVLVFGAVLAYYKLSIFFIFLLGASLYILWTLLFLKKRAEIDYKLFDESSGNQSSTIQLINGMQEIKLNGSEKRRRWEWEAIQLRLFKISIRGLKLSQTQTIGGSFLNELKNILITFVAAKSVIDGEMTLGMMLSVQYIIGQLNGPINNFVSFIQDGQDAKLSLERLAEIHNKEDDEKNTETYLTSFPKDKTITLSNINFRYGSSASELVLKDINLTIPEGKVTAIVGASGSGKTTLIKLLLKFYKPTSGNIHIGNTNINSISSSFLRKHCGTVMQDGYIFADSIYRNVTESDSEGLVDKEKLLKSVQIANIEPFIESMPLGYHTRIGSSGMGLSGGQKQRILIARAVYKDPQYLFFDEATSALDANNEKVIIENLAAFFKGKTAIIVAHRLSTVKNADNIIVLDKGEIVESGTHSELTAKKGAYYTLVKNQLELGD